MRGGNWQRSGGKGRRPEPVELPGDKPHRKPAADRGRDVAQRLRNLGLIPATGA